MSDTGTLQITNVYLFLFYGAACLLSGAAVTFGFMSRSMARLRVELQWRAQVDELTGLLNRWALKRVVTQEMQRARRSGREVAMLMIDLDGLKSVNDSNGHACGDVVLQTVAVVLQQTVRGQDSVARMGGDEFCVLLPETTGNEAMTVAERLRREVEELVIQYRGERVQVRASMGVASSSISGLSWQALVDHSDLALYRAKRSGGDRVILVGPEDFPPMDAPAPVWARAGETKAVGLE